ncbi:MAG: pyridoxal-phosphate dependent enzyme [bacterium]|nr:pyridoxal-phosphate dependent enzyme [bacterium]
MIREDILENVGNTPMVKIKLQDLAEVDLHAKLEFYNPTGSVKDRAAYYIINKLLALKEINRDTTLIESSSGNFGIALSAYCKKNGLKFICVVDPHITRVNEMLIRSLGAEVIKVTEPDENGGYLLTRIRKLKALRQEIGNSYWVNQYGNPYNAEAYSETLAEEACAQMGHIDYIFLGISSGGTITGVSCKVKKKFPNAKVIGVDDVVMMDEVETIRMCRELLREYYIFAGGSSGSAFGAVKKYFSKNKPPEKVNVLTIFPDRGERYIDTIYNEEWCCDFVKNQKEMKEM